MSENKLKVSVITVCKNEVDTIEQAILSVMAQDYFNIEHIIIDGKSTDGTVEIINKYKDKIGIFVSECDRGVYDAMNKGTDLALGDVVIFLNANDTFFAKNIVSKAVELLEESASDIVYGDAMMIGKHKNSGIIVKYDKVNKWFLLRSTICHQAIFAKKKLYDDIGKFDLRFKIAADYEWLLRAIVGYGAKATYLDDVVCNYSLDGMSNRPEIRSLTLKEYDKISIRYFGLFLSLIKKLYNFLLLIAYKTYSFFRKKFK